MKGLTVAATVSILLLLLVQNSLARPGKDVFYKKSEVGETLINNTGVITEDNILKGDIEPIDDRKISDAIFNALSKSPDHVSQIDAHSENTTTFREMKDRSIRLAVWMEKQGISPNDIIVECSHNHLDTYIPLLATFFVDAIFSPWETNISLNKARLQLQQLTPKLIFTNEETADVLLEAAKLENMDVKLIVFGKHSSLQSLSEIMNFQTEEEVDKFAIVNKKKSNEVSVILFSAGTTSAPKGIMLSSKSVYLIASGNGRTNAPKEIRVLWISMFHWISGFRQALQTVVLKKTRIIGQFSDENQLFQAIEKYKVHTAGLPIVWTNSISKSNSIQKYNIESLKSVTITGTKFNRKVFLGLRQKLPGVFILYLYGATETGGFVAASSLKSEHPDSVGFVIPNRKIKFVDLTLDKAVGPNQRGELYVKSPSMMIGYYKNSAKTQEAVDSDGWYHTGDTGYYLENGEIFIADRISELIKYKDYQISPADLEVMLLTHPDVEEAVVVSIPDERDGELPVAFVKKVSGSKATKEEISGTLSIFEDHKQLHGGLHFIDKMPLTLVGKIAKKELRQLAMDLSIKKET